MNPAGGAHLLTFGYSYNITNHISRVHVGGLRAPHFSKGLLPLKQAWYIPWGTLVQRVRGK